MRRLIVEVSQMGTLKFFLSLLYALVEALWILLCGIVAYLLYLFKKVKHEQNCDDNKIKCSLCTQDISDKSDKVRVEVHSGDVFYFYSDSHAYLHLFLSGWSY